MEADYRYTIDDVAEVFNVNRETVRRWCREGRIEYIKLPGAKGEYRFSKANVDKFIQILNMKTATNFPKYPKSQDKQKESINEK